jgi:anaerobic selenocysteine-containing dehydrogenase
LMLGLQEKPYMQATRTVKELEGEQRDEGSIYVDLAKACGKPLYKSRIAQWFFESIATWHKIIKRKSFPTLPQEFLLNLLLRICGQKSFGHYLKFPNGKLMPDHKEKSFLGKRVVTEDGKIHLAPKELLIEANKLSAAFEKEIENQDGLRLITKRAVTTHNSWTHNLDRMVAMGRDTNYLYMHPEDAVKLNLADADVVDVKSKTGEVRLPLKVIDELMPGTVALPHGWGHQHAKGLSVAAKTRGVNVNILAADGAENLEPISGMAQLTGIPVEVTKSAGTQKNSWSGM